MDDAAQGTFVSYVLSFLPLVVLLALFVLLIRLRLFERFWNRVADRKLGKGQGVLLQEAARTGVVPPGADVAAWRAAVGARLNRPKFFLWVSPFLLFFMAVLLLVGGVQAGTRRDLIGNGIPAMVIGGTGLYLLQLTKRAVQDRKRLRQILDRPDDQDGR